MSFQRRSRLTVLSVAATCAAALVVMFESSPSASGEEPVPEPLLHRVVAEATRSGFALRSVREMRAGTRSGKHQAWMVVETQLTPGGNFSWSVLDEGGSARTREKVLHALLKNEAASWHDDANAAAALTPANYVLTLIDRLENGEFRLRLRPRRADTKLVDGVLTVTADGHPRRLEGRMAKSPSFWVKSVTIVKRWERFHGIALPTTLETLADLRLFGQATLTVRYQYREVAGHSVMHAVSTVPMYGPSPEILALHRSVSRE